MEALNLGRKSTCETQLSCNCECLQQAHELECSLKRWWVEYRRRNIKNMEETRPMTPGEMAVGMSFNPSGDATIARLKELFAEAFDIVENSVPADDGTVPTARKRKMRDSALHEIVTAQMWAVKVVTLKY